ncbi:MAG TPA: response regulator transcription factor [Terriglobales bacterium]|nr:response regulator transcription factor [Terriglobales bacterium]
MRCLISDNSPVVRRGLRRILSESISDLFTEETVSSETLRLMSEKAWDLVILGTPMEASIEEEILQKIRDNPPCLPILIFSEDVEERYGVSYLRAGAHGYLSKAATSEEIVVAVKTVLSGGGYLSKRLMDHLAEELRSENQSLKRTGLSQREYEVMLMIAKGEAVKQIAHRLNLSPKTVSTYRKRLLKKIHEQNNAGVTLYALRKCLID